MKKTSRKSNTARIPRRTQQGSNAVTRRKVIVFFSLVGALSLTTILLRAMAPSPMTPDAAVNVLVASAASLESVFSTHQPVEPNRWQYVFVHQSKTESGDASTLNNSPAGLTDHFVIGNGEGCSDGELQIGPRWDQQNSASAPPGANRIDPACVSICLIGDFDKRPPTPAQLGRLTQLVEMLQSHFHMSPNRVILLNDQGGSAAGLGRYFPSSAFHDQLYSRPTVN